MKISVIRGFLVFLNKKKCVKNELTGFSATGERVGRVTLQS